jgi:Mg/Co/Ni transporter MgtE
MAADDAADLLLEIQQERRLPILHLVPTVRQQQITGLLGHSPSSAGGLMNPEFVAVPATATAAEAVAKVRASGLEPRALWKVCVVDAQGRLVAGVSLAELVRAEPDSTLDTLVDAHLPSVQAEADLPEVARLMADYNLLAMPVVDPAGIPVGMVSVDDVLELLLPDEWRRRAGVARD